MKKALKQVHIVVLVVLAVTGLVFTGGAKGKPPADTPVTATIDGLGINTMPTLRIQSDQLGSYRNSSSLQSIIQGIGDWEVDMINFTSSPQRKVLIDLRDPIPGSAPNGGSPINPFGASGYQTVRARFISKCSQNGVNLMNMQTNTPYFCPLALAFDDVGGVRYRLNMNPTNYGGTNWLQVACLSTGTNGRCNQWKIQPSVTQPNGERKNVAKLLKIATKPNQTDQDYGDFYLAFNIHLTSP